MCFIYCCWQLILRACGEITDKEKKMTDVIFSTVTGLHKNAFNNKYNV